jgi:hypothetical protein
MKIIGGIILILHGLVHIWYITLSQGWVEFQAEMGWTGRSWLLSGLLGAGAAKMLAAGLYALAGLGLVAGGIGVLAQADWMGPILLGAAGLSALVILVFWDGSSEMLVQKGLLGFLINLGILGVMLLGK